jgi:hypothetical protein
VIHKRFILLIGIFLISHGPAAAQISAPRIILAQEHVAPIITMLPTVSTPLPSASLLSQDPGKSSAHFSFSSARAYEPDYSLKHLSQVNEIKTLILTQSSLPLGQLWRGRFQLDAFQGTLQLQKAKLGCFGDGDMLNSCFQRQSYPGGPGSLSFSGLSLSFHFGRDARIEHPVPLWQRLTEIVGAVLN